MPRIEWVKPEHGEGSVDDIVSHQPEVIDALKTHAHAMAVTAEFILDTSAKHRTGAAKIDVQQEKLDYYVYLHDPENKRGALSIEEGHWTHGYDRRRNATLGDALGPIRNGRHGDGGASTWVEGLHPLAKAVEHAIATRKI